MFGEVHPQIGFSIGTSSPNVTMQGLRSIYKEILIESSYNKTSYRKIFKYGNGEMAGIGNTGRIIKWQIYREKHHQPRLRFFRPLFWV